MSLYTKYRPRDWDSVVSQDYITTILRNSLKSGKVSHAYLFHGSRGTGKTTSARILAKALNCTHLKNGNPCHECENCRAFDNETMLDVIEIDGASNNGVENVRELIERARFEPNQGKYKIYIIDEVHMLSLGAFNALLKTLEEPPSHVKFILATTEIEKVPETIRSRTLRFDFKKITLENIIDRLTYVTKSEGVKAEPAALEIIAKSARGGLRDALTLLEQNIIDEEVSATHVRYTLSLIEDELLEKIIEALKNKDISNITSIIEALKERHVQVRSLFDQILYRLRDKMVEHLEDSDFFIYSEISELFEESYGKIRLYPDGMMLIEIALYRIAKKGEKEILSVQVPTLVPTIPQPKPSLKTEEIKREIVPEKTVTNHEESVVPPKIEEKKDTSQAPTEGKKFSYPALVSQLKETNPALTIDLKTARFTLEGQNLTLIFSKNWNFERVNTPKIRHIIAETCEKEFSGTWNILCKLEENGTRTNLTEGVF